MVYRLTSCFAAELENFRQIKLASGVKDVSIERYINYFDDFIRSHDVKKIIFTNDLNKEWIKPRSEEGEVIRYVRVNYSIEFLTYLKAKGYDVYIPRRLPYKSSRVQFYIYTEEERDQYFSYIDSIDYVKDPMIALAYPVIFRILYCCGTRVGETLSIKKKEVDLEQGIILLRKTKNGKERIIPLSRSLHELLKQYASKCFYLKTDEDYLFSHIDKRRINEQSIYWAHRRALEHAEIPYVGGGNGPRVHDWRHTMAVTSLENFSSSGANLYNVLPILKNYLGHTKVVSTEKYLHMVSQNYKSIISKAEKTTKYITGDNEYENE